MHFCKAFFQILSSFTTVLSISAKGIHDERSAQIRSQTELARRPPQAVPLPVPLYFPGSTPSKVKGTESRLPASCRLRFSPCRLTDCSVTVRSPHASGGSTARQAAPKTPQTHRTARGLTLKCCSLPPEDVPN